MLAALVDVWPRPVAELILIGHSMGGLVIRSAFHYGAAAGHDWPERLRAAVFLGTPHHGAPLERHGNLINVLMDASPYVAPFTRLGKRRRAGITDLRYSSLIDDDWAGRDRFAHGPCNTCIVPLPDAPSFTVAAVLGGAADSPATRLLGDGLVPLDSALGRHTDPARALPFDESNSWIGYGMGHLDLLGRPEVYERILQWLTNH
jgi:pimeloyl-ACP methyl ester carboxylesterase